MAGAETPKPPKPRDPHASRPRQAPTPGAHARRAGHCRIIAIRISPSVSLIRSPDKSTVTVCSVPVKRNGGLVVRHHGRAGIGAAGQPARVEGDRRGDRELGLPDQAAVDVELSPARGAFARREVRLPGGLELEPQLVPPGRHRVHGGHLVHLAPHIVVRVVQHPAWR